MDEKSNRNMAVVAFDLSNKDVLIQRNSKGLLYESTEELRQFTVTPQKRKTLCNHG